MEYRNLKRFFLVGKVLRKYNKGKDYELTQKRLMILLTVHFMQHHKFSTTFANIHRYFVMLGHSSGWLNFKDCLDSLVDADLLEQYELIKANKISKPYRITTRTKLVLSDLENMLRKERLDK